MDSHAASTPPAPEDRLEPQALVGCRYRVEEFHRRHGCGELYRCVDEISQRVVLLHRLRPEFGAPGVMDRLFESQASQASPDILEIHDYGRDLDDRPYLVRPWRDGAALAAIEGPHGFQRVLTLARLICLALADAHDEQRVHGGLDPSSVIVSPALADEGIALLGFGLTVALDAGVERRRILSRIATPAYAAPELIRGEPFRPATDVYALGVLVWQLLCGAPPFRGPVLRILDAHQRRALPRFTPKVEVPAGFESLLRRALAKDPADRFAHARELLAQLEIFAAFAPLERRDEDDATLVLARPAAPSDRPSSPWRQRARAFLLGIAGMATVVAAPIAAELDWRASFDRVRHQARALSIPASRPAEVGRGSTTAP